MLRIMYVVVYGENHRQALLLSDDDGSDDRFVVDGPRLDAEDPQQMLDTFTALMAAAPELPKEWGAARFVERLPADSQPRVVTSMRGC